MGKFLKLKHSRLMLRTQIKVTVIVLLMILSVQTFLLTIHYSFMHLYIPMRNVIIGHLYSLFFDVLVAFESTACGIYP
jgi:hypothetical protein